jgi:hypothetical protein
MRRLMCIAASLLLLAVPLWAQRGGRHASFGGHSSGGGHSFGGGRMSSPHVSRGSGPAHRFSSRSFSTNRGLSANRRNFVHNRFRGSRFRTFGFRNNCFAFGCRNFGLPWLGWGYNPWLWNDWNSDSSFDASYDNDRAQANEMNEQNLEEQRMFRQEEADGDRDLYHNSRRSDPAIAAAVGKSGDPVVPPTVLVFRDQRRQEIQNYAIVGRTLWSFSSGRTQKVPLANLDLAATEKANDDRGITFRIPAADGAE